MFVHITDTHINVHNPQRSDLLRQAISEINSIRPDFVIVTGDLVDWSYGSNWEEYDDIICECEVPVYSLVGNHDYRDSPWDVLLEPFADRFDKSIHDRAIDLDARSKCIGSEILPQALVPENPEFNYGPLLGDFSFDHGSIHVVCLNSGHDHPLEITAEGPVLRGSGLTDSQMDWLREDLSGEENIYIFMHHPVFTDGDSHRIANNLEEFIGLCSEHGVIAVFWGHIVRNLDHLHRGTRYCVTSALRPIEL